MQKPAYEVRISDWSADVCSSDLAHRIVDLACRGAEFRCGKGDILPLAHLIPHLPLARARLAIDEAARNIRLIAMNRDRKRVVQGKSVSVSVDLGGRRRIKKKKTKIHRYRYYVHIE